MLVMLIFQITQSQVAQDFKRDQHGDGTMTTSTPACERHAAQYPTASPHPAASVARRSCLIQCQSWQKGYGGCASHISLWHRQWEHLFFMVKGVIGPATNSGQGKVLAHI